MDNVKGKERSADDIECKVTKFDILLLNNGWNDKNEKLIASIGENSEAYKWMHEKASKRYYLMNRIVGIFIVVLNAVLSAQTTFTADCQKDIFQKVLIYIVTILSVINNFLNFQELATNHKNASSHFGDITHDVQQQMCLYRKDRESAVKYVQHTLKKYDSVNTNSPAMPDYILKELNKKYKNSGISMPDKMHKIDIIADEPRPIDNDNSSNDTRNINININNDVEMGRLGTYNIDNYNPLKIQGDITEDDVEELSEYIQKSKNAQYQFQFVDRVRS
jgi:hypothetical protein